MELLEREIEIQKELENDLETELPEGLQTMSVEDI